jgi:cation transport ATPase
MAGVTSPLSAALAMAGAAVVVTLNAMRAAAPPCDPGTAA